MKTKTIGEIQLALGIIFFGLVIFGCFFVIKYIGVESLTTAVKGATSNWAQVQTDYNLSVGMVSGNLVSDVLNISTVVKIGFGLMILIVLNGLIGSSLLITQGLKNINCKK